MDIFAGAVLLDKEKRIYLIKEDDRNNIGQNRWNLPGGSVDLQESIIDGVVRENQEETGYSANPKSLLGCYKCVKGDATWLYVVIELETSGDKKVVTDTNVNDGRWFTQEEFLNFDQAQIVHPDMKLVYKTALENKGLPLETVKLISY